MKKCLLLLLLSFSFVACEINSQVNSDSYDLMPEEQKSRVQPFNPDNVGKAFAFSDSMSYSYEEITAKDIKANLGKGRKAIVMVWAVWCKNCIAKFPSLMAVADSSDNTDVYLVADGYELERMDKHLWAHKYHFTPYIMSKPHYGTKLDQKMTAFHNDFKVKPAYNPGYSQNYLFNSDGSLFMYSVGVINADTMAMFTAR